MAKVVSIKVGNRYHFATVRVNGTLSKSVRTWDSERDAIAAGRREFKVSK